jgi:hypothetical protein
MAWTDERWGRGREKGKTEKGEGDAGEGGALVMMLAKSERVLLPRLAKKSLVD